MFKFTKTGVFALSTIIIFFVAQIFINKYTIANELGEDIMDKQILDKMPVIETIEKTDIWKIEIPQILLTADISEGNTKEILNQYIGHFQNTSKEQGNVGLYASNRGYNQNYFKDLKLLKKGDEIIYKHNNFEKTYEVEKCRIIKDTEYEYLEETEENSLTLITWIENYPKYRRCIQATEK